MRSNRVPPEMRNANPQVGQLSAFRPGPFLCLKYKDKKDVYMLATQHDGSVVSVKRGRGKRSRQDVVSTKPMCIVGYNSNICSVDKRDQMLEPYSIARKSRKWRCLSGWAPSNLRELFRPLSSCAGRRTLRSSAHGNLVVPFARPATMQTRSFSVVDPKPGMDFQ